MAKFPDPPTASDFEIKGSPAPAFPWEQWFQAVSAALTTPLIPIATPTSSSATGTQGQITMDSNFLYGCIAKNSWKRVAWTTF